MHIPPEHTGVKCVLCDLLYLVGMWSAVSESDDTDLIITLRCSLGWTVTQNPSHATHRSHPGHLMCIKLWSLSDSWFGVRYIVTYKQLHISREDIGGVTVTAQYRGFRCCTTHNIFFFMLSKYYTWKFSFFPHNYL